MQEGEKKIIASDYFFSSFPVDSNVKHCVVSYILPLITKIFSRSAWWNTVLMFYNITRAVTTAFNALRNAVFWSNLRKLYYNILYILQDKIHTIFVTICCLEWLYGYSRCKITTCGYIQRPNIMNIIKSTKNRVYDDVWLKKNIKAFYHKTWKLGDPTQFSPVCIRVMLKYWD